MSPRRVLFLHSSSGRYGADRQLVALTSGLDSERFRPLVVLPDHGELAADLRGAGVEVRVRPLAVLRRALLSPPGLAQVAASLAADARALSALVAREDISLIHTNTSVTLGGAAAARLTGVPHVWHVREIYTDFARWWPAYRRVLLGADALPCVSSATRAQFGTAPAARVIHDALAPAPPPADRHRARAALGLPDDAFACALLGRISPWKGQDVLVRALAERALADRGAIAVVAGTAWPGEEDREQTLRDLCAQLGVADRVRFVGFRDDRETLFAAADVIVVASTRPDPFPNSALEAAAAGCCVAASDTGGLPEMLEDGRTGRLVAPGDPRALAAAIAELADDPGRRARLGAAAARDIAARFGPERLAEATQALYDELLTEI